MKVIEPWQNISLSKFTTWKIGGPAEWFAEPNSLEEIRNLISWANQYQIPIKVIGAGSNLLVSDKGIDGLVICLKHFHGYKLDKKHGILEANSGEGLPRIAGLVAKAGLSGLEWAVGIPGTIGGATIMNAGAQGGCIGDQLISTFVLPLDGGKPFSFTKKDLDMSYRQTLLQGEEFVVISSKFHLQPGGDPKEITAKTVNNLNQRKSTQPYEWPSCGSVFRNPEPRKAGEIIEKLGFKGYKQGGAEISKKHANFIVNTGTATAKDITTLITHITTCVKDVYGISLQTEVKKLGFK